MVAGWKNNKRTFESPAMTLTMSPLRRPTAITTGDELIRRAPPTACGNADVGEKAIAGLSIAHSATINIEAAIGGRGVCEPTRPHLLLPCPDNAAVYWY